MREASQHAPGRVCVCVCGVAEDKALCLVVFFLEGAGAELDAGDAGFAGCASDYLGRAGGFGACRRLLS